MLPTFRLEITLSLNPYPLRNRIVMTIPPSRRLNVPTGENLEELGNHDPGGRQTTTSP